MSRTIRVTLFENFVATTKREIAVTLDELAARVLSTTAPAKKRLPWLTLAIFGDKRTGKNSLRHDGNLLAISGIEADYDGGAIAFDAACGQLERTGAEAVIYTSPSHAETEPRWRVLAPLPAELPPERREQMMGRLNGQFGGVFAPESWTLSQSYYYGSVNQNPLHRVKVVSGIPLDLHDDLDGASIGRPGAVQPPKGVDSTRRHRAGSLDVNAMRRVIASGGSFHEGCVRLLGRWAQEGIAFLDAQQRLLTLFDEVPSGNRDGRWQSRRNEVPRLVRDIYGKHAPVRQCRGRGRDSGRCGAAQLSQSMGSATAAGMARRGIPQRTQRSGLSVPFSGTASMPARKVWRCSRRCRVPLQRMLAFAPMTDRTGWCHQFCGRWWSPRAVSGRSH